MKKEIFNHVRLGIFIIGGLAFLVVMLYLIGKNKHLLGKGFKLRARFENIQGLKKGNNVRFAGIDAGTVEDIIVLNDTLIEVCMRLDAEMKGVVKCNAIASIGTDGLVGNKIINIYASHLKADPAQEASLLISRKPTDTDEMLQTLGKTNINVLDISSRLKNITTSIDTSVLINALLKDSALLKSLDKGVHSFSKSMQSLHQFSKKMKEWSRHIDKGRGVMGALVYDTTIKTQLHHTIVQYKETGKKIEDLSDSLTQLVHYVHQWVDTGGGAVPYLWKDPYGLQQTKLILNETNRGLEHFNEVMQALKHSIFFRGYFRREGKKEP